MALPVRITLSSATSSKVVPLNLQGQSPFNVGIGVAVAAGSTLTYTVEHTFDDVFANNFDASTATWYPNSGLTAQTASKDGNYAYPITGVRLRVSAWTVGSATITILQAV